MNIRELPKNIWAFLDGKKSFIGAAIIFIAGGFKALGKIEDGAFEALVAVGGAIAAFGLRSALGKLLGK